MKNNKNYRNTKHIDGIVKSEDIIGVPEQTVSLAPKSKIETKKITKISPTKKKKTGFLVGVINELKEVEWPTFKYVVGWSATIILFTALIGSVLGFTDYYFESGVKFVDCTSPNGSKNQSIQDCAKDLTSNLTFQKYFNRDPAKVIAPAVKPVDDKAITPTITQPTITSDPNTVVTPEINKVNNTDTPSTK